jgi:hypothetical protein
LTRLLASWTELRARAGLPEAAPRRGEKRYTLDDLLIEYDRVVRKLGKEPTWAELNRHASIARQTYQDRIGNKSDLRRAYQDWRDLRDRAAAGDRDAVRKVEANAVENRTIEPDHIDGIPHDPLDVSAMLPPAGWEPKPFDPDERPRRRTPLHETVPGKSQ